MSDQGSSLRPVGRLSSNNVIRQVNQSNKLLPTHQNVGMAGTESYVVYAYRRMSGLGLLQNGHFDTRMVADRPYTYPFYILPLPSFVPNPLPFLQGYLID